MRVELDYEFEINTLRRIDWHILFRLYDDGRGGMGVWGVVVKWGVLGEECFLVRFGPDVPARDLLMYLRKSACVPVSP